MTRPATTTRPGTRAVGCGLGACGGSCIGTAIASVTLWAVLMLAIGLGPSGASADELERAIALANEGRFDEAHELIVPLLNENPGDLRAQLLEGILQVRQGQFEEAVRIFEALRDAYPERSEPYNNLAAVYVAQDRLDEAHAALLAAIARKPQLPTAHENLADLYIRLARSSNLRAQDLSSTSGQRPGVATGEPVTSVDAGEDEPALTQQTPASDTEMTTGGGDTETSGLCVRTTRFDVAAAAAEAESWLQERGVGAHVRQERREVVKDHWVYQPPLGSRAQAVAMMEEMRAKGVEDIAVIRHGDLANGISLGIYRSTDNLRRRVAALESIGYPVQYETTLETVTTYWLEARMVALPAFMRADWAARFPNHVLEVTDCN